MARFSNTQFEAAVELVRAKRSATVAVAEYDALLRRAEDYRSGLSRAIQEFEDMRRQRDAAINEALLLRRELTNITNEEMR